MYTNLRKVLIFDFLKVKNIAFALDFNKKKLGGYKNIIHLLIILLPPKLYFLPKKLVIQYCYNL